MKVQFLTLLLVASAAMARPVPMDQAPSSSELIQRSLIGNEYTVQNQLDNSQGKHAFRVDHNGDSSVRKGLLYDLVDNNEEKEEGSGFEFKRRSLLGDLFGGDSTSISNVNDNSKHTQTMNQHGNKHITITKTRKESYGGSGDGGRRSSEMSPEEFFDRRDLAQDSEEEMATEHQENTPLARRGLLFGGDSMSISNVNDNSQHTQTMNQHGNKDLSITRKTFRQTAPVRSKNEKDIDSFFDRRDLLTENEENRPNVERRSLFGDLFGGSSTTISNVNDNSQTKKTYNSHGNKDVRINSKVHKNIRNNKRGLLFGGGKTSISNENDNSKETKTFNSHDNVDKKISSKVDKNFGANSDEDEWF
ncbi:hypothetical protein BGX26_001777 [Mortierella sp. AD094]|nr:hypothetical protein BGX26_001777 [Mortierella sp. AD094]